jgi:NAD(P)-dependent dehydrogenase (short-subunit alcohol dehydrogenase family)
MSAGTDAAKWQPRSVLVIGASRGIGLELVRQYRADGVKVVGTARSDAGLATLQALGAQALRLDVTSTTSASGLAWRVDGEDFDVVVVNAGVYGPGLPALQTPTEADFDQVMHTNVLGPMRVIPQLAEALAPGARLGVISSIMGSLAQRSNGGVWLYRASKAAVNSVLRDASFALAGRAICVALHPGWVRTDMGGAEADLAVEDSVRDLRRTLAALTPADNGCFLNHDGQPLAW